MNDANELKGNNPPKPKTTITYLEGEILSVKINKWGTNGKLSTEFGIYNYKLKDSSSLANNILVGLKLAINNGYCFENKQGELVVSDGKFGNIKTEIDMNQFYSYTEESIIITGKNIEIKQNDGISVLKLELLFPPYTDQKIIVSTNSSNSDIISKKFYESIFRKIVRVKGLGSYSDFDISDIEILPKNHFLNLIDDIEKDNLEAFTAFNHIIFHQIQHVENIHNSFKNTLINMGKKISKSLLSELKDVLLDKILDGTVKFPYNLLIPHSDIDEYFSTMLTFLRNIINSEEATRNPEDLVIILKYYYPSYSRKLYLKTKSSEISK